MAENAPHWRNVVRVMSRIVDDFALDLPHAVQDMHLREFYDWISGIPYVSDGMRWGVETVGRVGALLKAGPLDCKKKAMLVAAWASVRCIPWRWCVVRYEGDDGPSHIYAEVKVRRPRDARRGTGGDFAWLMVDPSIPGGFRLGDLPEGVAEEWIFQDGRFQ